MRALLIVGAGGHGKVVADAALETGKWKEIIFLDDAWPVKKENGHWHVYGKAGQFEHWLEKCDSAIVAIGDNHLRMVLQSKLIDSGFKMATIIHPSAQVSRFARLGAGCVVCANAVVNVDSAVGEAVIINTGATVDHDCRLGDAVHIAPGTNLGGGVAVGDYSLVAIGAAVRNYVTIGREVTIGAGATVLSNIEDGVTAVGTPARPINQ
ncbi:MAG: acetyltransferase [Gallionella sp.]|nr:acetyltransferase [Gallionella sp.]